MNRRERFLATAEFDTAVSLLYEMGYWAGTIRQRYQEGLVKIERTSETLRLGDCVLGPLLGREERRNDLDRRTEKNLCGKLDFS